MTKDQNNTENGNVVTKPKSDTSTRNASVGEVFELVDSETQKLKKIIDFQSEQVNKQEAMIASLTMAYVEIFAAMDMMIKTVIKDYTEEEKTKFLREFEKYRSDVLKGMQEASRSGIEGLDPETQRTVENVVSEPEDN